MRNLAIVIALFMVGCAAPPPPPPKVAVDPVTEAWYAPAVVELAGLNREAASLLLRGMADDAAAKITKGQALSARLLAARAAPHRAAPATPQGATARQPRRA